MTDLHSSAELYPNQFPERLTDELARSRLLGVKRVSITDPDFADVVNEGTIKWAVTADGKLFITPKYKDGEEIPHTILTNGEAVLAAGEAEIVAAEQEFWGLEINRYSGHYLPGPDSLEIGKRIFATFGIAFEVTNNDLF